MKKAPRETKTLRAACSKVEPKKNFAPPQTPFPGAWDGQNLISWRPSLKIDARNFELSWKQTHKDRNTTTARPPAHPPVANGQDR